jgi:hypothetical protein
MQILHVREYIFMALSRCKNSISKNVMNGECILGRLSFTRDEYFTLA